MRIITPIRTLLGLGLLSIAGLNARADQVTFNVDMSSMTNSAGQPAYTEVRASGAFNGWSQSSILTNNGANIFTNTFEVPANGNYKYTCVINGGTEWEAGGDHGITLTGSAQTLPLLTFNYGGVVPIDFTTNNITFQVDMRVQGQTWVNGGGIITVSGGFNGWGGGNVLTNDSGAGYPTNWWYSGTFPAITQLMPPSATCGQKLNRFKFRANNGWEEPTTINCANNNDRFWDATTTGDKVLPLVLYSDASLCDTLDKDTTVTYILHITNGTQTITGHAFDNTQDTIHINGEALLGVWQNWNNLDCPQLVNNPVGSDFYEYTQVVPAGRPRNQKVKYGIYYTGATGIDNEAPNGQDHIQWIRTTNTTYVMAPVEFGTNYASARVQPQFGNLKVGAPSGGNVPVTWDGCACVTLQQRASLTSGTWTDLPETEGNNATNMPNTGTQFFRLQKRPNP
jgi:hypothetical protein